MAFEEWEAILVLGGMIYCGAIIINKIFFQNRKSSKESTRLIQKTTPMDFRSQALSILLYLFGAFFGMVGIWGIGSSIIEDDINILIPIGWLVVSLMISIYGRHVGKYGRKGKKAWMRENS